MKLQHHNRNRHKVGGHLVYLVHATFKNNQRPRVFLARTVASLVVDVGGGDNRRQSEKKTVKYLRMATLCLYRTVENLQTDWTDELWHVAASVRDVFLVLCCAKPSEHRHFFSLLRRPPTDRPGVYVTSSWLCFKSARAELRLTMTTHANKPKSFL